MALSPAVNDPTTAVEALGVILDLTIKLGRRQLETGYLADETGDLRLIYSAPTWNDYLSLAFDEIRLYGIESPQVVQYGRRLDAAVARLGRDETDTAAALGIDPQSLGLTRSSQLDKWN